MVNSKNDDDSINETLFRKTNKGSKVLLHEKEVFDVISISHEQYEHLKSRGMDNVLEKLYRNIFEHCLNLFVETYPVCNEETKVKHLQSNQNIFMIDSE